MSQWIKKGDKVIVLSGNEKGRTGTVLRKMADKVVIQGVNIRKKHARRQQKQAQMPTILEIETPIHISNVALCDENDQVIKAKTRLLPKGEKELYYVKDKKDVVLRVIRKSS